MAVFTQDLNFLLWYQPPTGTPLVSCGRSQAIPLWLLGSAQMSEPGCLERARLFPKRPPSRKHCPSSAHWPSISSRVNCCLTSLKRTGPGTLWVLYPQSTPKGGRTGSKSISKQGQAKSKEGSSVLSGLQRGNKSRLKSWCIPLPS